MAVLGVSNGPEADHVSVTSLGVSNGPEVVEANLVVGALLSISY